MKLLSKDFCRKGYETYYSPYHNIIWIKKGEIDIQILFWRLSGEAVNLPLRYIENKFGFFIGGLSWLLAFSHHGKINTETVNSPSKMIKLFGSKFTDIFPECIRIWLIKLLNKIGSKTGNRRGLVFTPSHFFINLKEIDFYDMKVKVPKDSEEYLVHYFGEDWRVPKKEWVYVRKDKKIISKTERIGEVWEYKKFGNRYES
ncbi:hypothetical protein ES705_41115 [subsurface metagenome]